MKLILASASPRRADLLRAAGFNFATLATETSETRRPGEAASEMVRRLAEVKARAAVVAACDPPKTFSEPVIVIGADTVVELDGEILGKPDSIEAARRMLRRLSGKTHRVLTGVALIRLPDGAARFAVETTAVHFAELTAEEIERYAATGEPLDKAGGYAVQGFAGRFVERIEGCYFNVVGLPVPRVYRLLVELGWRDDTAPPK